jgi:hypothetical protein
MPNSKLNRRERGEMKTIMSVVKFVLMTAALLAGALGLNGCAEYASVGIRYSDAYYVPDYRPFYAAYFYNGVPYWGPDIAYIRRKVVIRDVDRHVNVRRNIYYGGHHIVRDRPRTGAGYRERQPKLPSNQQIKRRS